jgi:hypothetical protein
MTVRRALRLRPGRLAVCRLPADTPPPAWVFHREAEFFSITRTSGELSVVCAEDDLPPSMTKFEAGWRALELEGPIPFEAVGVLASLVVPLAAAGIPVFALSTFDTDYVLVKEEQLAPALAALAKDFLVDEGVRP